MKKASLPSQVDGSAKREIRDTLKSCVPASPLTHDAILESCGKWEFSKTPQHKELTSPRGKRTAWSENVHYPLH
ncbi:hypothetical protein GCM10011391_28840 [Pullulanibacillus camelliae]|uniref:Uncharacterized protein n=1 Tax=Pullulanibacillus camelliae TaxID=1707096 RepID=A0A8J2YKC5_9BACL|nr:hypothetical protein GCM10011391_28840 [Pullulanibacillus camelliae]